MKNKAMIIRSLYSGGFALLAFVNAVSAAPVSSTASGANPAAIQTTVDQFRNDLGANDGGGDSFANGRREINWNGVAGDIPIASALIP